MKSVGVLGVILQGRREGDSPLPGTPPPPVNNLHAVISLTKRQGSLFSYCFCGKQSQTAESGILKAKLRHRLAPLQPRPVALPHPLNAMKAINIRSSTHGMCGLIVECTNWKIASNHERMHQIFQVFNL